MFVLSRIFGAFFFSLKGALLFPVFAQKSGLDFNKKGIKLKETGGKTHLVKYYADNRKLFKIPVFILLDADGKDIIDELNDILEKKDEVYLIQKGEIEDILPHSLIVRAVNNNYSMEATITEDDLRNVFHVLPTDSLIEARQKINEVISNDDFLYQYFHKDPLVWELKEFTPGYWTVSVKDEKILTKKDLLELGYTEDDIAKSNR